MSAIKPHWEYFLAIEADLSACARFVDFHPDNHSTYSIEFAQIILRAASECDVVARELTGTDNGKWLKLRKDWLFLAEKSVPIPRFGLKLSPWQRWLEGEKEKPGWFLAFENIKHDRLACFKQANLANAIEASAGLLVLLLESYQRHNLRFTFPEMPRLFHIMNGLDFDSVTGLNLIITDNPSLTITS